MKLCQFKSRDWEMIPQTARSKWFGLLAFFTGFVNEEKAVDVILVNSSRKFDSSSHNIFVSKLGLCSLDGTTTRRVKNWLHGLAQRVMVNRSHLTWSDKQRTTEICPGTCCV